MIPQYLHISYFYFNYSYISWQIQFQRGLLKLKGGTNLQNIIKNMFKTLIKDEILMLYSWKGARGKNAFRSFKIVNLIIGKRL